MPHTPGPWLLGIRDHRGWIPIRSSDQRTVAEVICQLPRETQANAQILATALESLEILETIVSTLDEDTCNCAAAGWFGEGHSTGCPLYYQADAEAVIAKARKKVAP